MAVIWGIPYLLIKIAVGELTPASLVFTGLIIAAVPLIGAVLQLLTRGDDRLDRRRVSGLIIGLVGVAVLLGLNVSVSDLRAVAEVSLVAVGYAAGPIIIARRLPTLPAVGVVAASLVLTALFYAPLALPQLPRTLPSGKVVMAVVILAVVCTALAFLLFFALIGEVGPVRATIITYFNPAVALLLGVTLLQEPFTVGAVVGFSLILAGSVLATRRTSALAGRAPAASSKASAFAARYRRERRRRSQG
jgi:drug/metabolite transporter (DMT)-like permease